MNYCEDCGEVHMYDLGDRVRLAQNHLLTGQVIGEMDWGAKYHVRFGSTVTAIWFDAVELEPDPDFMPPAMTAEPPVAPAEEGSVIFHDFKAARTATGGMH